MPDRDDAAAAWHLAAATDRDIADLHAEVRGFRSEMDGLGGGMATKEDLEAFRRATTASFTAVRADHRSLQDEVPPASPIFAVASTARPRGLRRSPACSPR